MDVFVWSTVILAIWGAIGPILGVRYGQDLSHRYQRQRWIADSKKKEFKELLGTLDSVIAFYARENVVPKEKKAEQSEYLDTNHKAMWCIRDRLFIASEMKEHNVLERWRNLLNTFLAGGEFGTFTRGFNELREELVSMATKDIQ